MTEDAKFESLIAQWESLRCVDREASTEVVSTPNANLADVFKNGLAEREIAEKAPIGNGIGPADQRSPLSEDRLPLPATLRHESLWHLTSSSKKFLGALLVLVCVLSLFALQNRELAIARHEAEIAKTRAETAHKTECQRADALEKELCVNQMELADFAWRDADLRRMRSALDSVKPELRSLDWKIAKGMSESPPRLAYFAARPKGLHRIQNLQTSRDGNWLVSEELGSVPGSKKCVYSTHVLSASEGVPKLGLGAGFLTFSPDGTQVLRRESSPNQNATTHYRLSLVQVANGKTVWQTDLIEDNSCHLFTAAFVPRNPIANEVIEFLKDTESPTSEQTSMIVVLTDSLVVSDSDKSIRRARFEFRDSATGQLVRTVDGDSVENATCATFNTSGSLLAISRSLNDSHTVTVLSSSTGKTLYTLRGHTGPINDVAFSNNDQRIATASDDRSLRIWDANTGLSQAIAWGIHGSVFAVAFNPSGDRVAGVGRGGGVRILDADSAELIRVLPTEDEELYGLVFSRDGTVVYAGGTDGVVYRIDLSQPACPTIGES